MVTAALRGDAEVLAISHPWLASWGGGEAKGLFQEYGIKYGRWG